MRHIAQHRSDIVLFDAALNVLRSEKGCAKHRTQIDVHILEKLMEGLSVFHALDSTTRRLIVQKVQERDTKKCIFKCANFQFFHSIFVEICSFYCFFVTKSFFYQIFNFVLQVEYSLAPQGTVLCKEGDPADACYIILDGKVSIHRLADKELIRRREMLAYLDRAIKLLDEDKHWIEFQVSKNDIKIVKNIQVSPDFDAKSRFSDFSSICKFRRFYFL